MSYFLLPAPHPPSPIILHHISFQRIHFNVITLLNLAWHSGGQEVAVCSTTAVLLVYATDQAKWLPQGPGSGTSRIYLYKNDTPRTYRIVSRNAQDKSVKISRDGCMGVCACEIAAGRKGNLLLIYSTPSTLHNTSVGTKHTLLHRLIFSCDFAPHLLPTMSHLLPILLSR